MQKLRVVWVVCTGIVLALVSFAFLPPHDTQADTVTWTSNTPPQVVSSSNTPSLGEWCERRYHAQTVPNVNILAREQGARPIDPSMKCLLSESQHGKLYVYRAPGMTLLAVQFKGDPNAYWLEGIECEHCRYIPQTDTLVNIIADPNQLAGGALVMYENFTSKIQVHPDILPGNRYFQLNKTSYDYRLDDTANVPRVVKHIETSTDGKWLALEFVGAGIMRMNIETKQVTKFADWKTQYTSSSPAIEYDISHDGRFIAVMGEDAVGRIYEVNGVCGTEVTAAMSSTDIAQNQQTPCSYRSMSSLSYDLGDEFISNFRYATLSRFSNDTGEFSLRATSYTSSSRTIKLRAPDYIPPPPLDYLALGDSYSSGEGDTEKDDHGKKYYQSHTDNEENKSANQPREKCHVSTRSYPYILAEGMNLGTPTNDATTKWQTVACSGAQKYDVTSASSNYLGQGKGGGEGGKPRLAGYNATSLQATALNEFIPGREKQIEFVKKYKPKVITLTMGGNDIGFGDKIEACASPIAEEETCSIATEAGRAGLRDQILGQYSKLKAFYEKIYNESNKTSKIYVLGYPQFINEAESGSCGYNIGSLNKAEKRTIHNAVKFMNAVIRQATKAAGVGYVDIEDSLEDGRLCDDGQKYMTGITNVFGLKGNELQESFHPNAKGHFEIAMAVWDQVNNESLLDHAVCPDVQATLCPDFTATKEAIEIPSYFRIEEDVTDREYTHLTNSHITKGQPQNIRVSKYSFEKDSVVTVLAYSEPTEVGQYTASADGELDIEITIPDILPAGYHTLVLSGKTYSGEPIEYEQIVLVQGSDPSDIDENGIPDSQQPCGPFLAASGTDEDKDGIDDACDPEIGPAPENPEGPDEETPPGTDPKDPSTPTNPPAQPNLLQTIISKVTQVITTTITFIQKVLKWW